VSDDAPKPEPPGALVVDFGPVHAFEERLGVLEAAWAALPAEVRVPLARLIWLHPNGSVAIYREPAPPGVEETGPFYPEPGSRRKG
jgi:hypothetical protein